MSLLTWKEEFSVGVPEVDHEHRQLIDLINKLCDRMCREAAGPEEVSSFLGEIYLRISAHFALEEKLMRDHGYSGYHDHKADHENLLDELRDLMEDFEYGTLSDIEVVRTALENWFNGHFRGADARLHGALTARQGPSDSS